MSCSMDVTVSFFFFFFNDTATTEIYTLSLHDALPICVEHRLGPAGRTAARSGRPARPAHPRGVAHRPSADPAGPGDRKSTRLNSSHGYISYAVFCLKKKKNALVVRGLYHAGLRAAIRH